MMLYNLLFFVLAILAVSDAAKIKRNQLRNHTARKLTSGKGKGSATTASSHVVLCGRPDKCTETSPQNSIDTDLHEVRCCSDTEITDWVNRNGIWTESNIGGSCHLEKTWSEAYYICDGVGARLCTQQELEDGTASSTGCGLNNDLIWSSTEA